jgi:hypothetical protein
MTVHKYDLVNHLSSQHVDPSNDISNTVGLPNLDSAVPKGSDSGIRCPNVFVN